MNSWYQGVFDLSWANAESGELESRTTQGRTVRVNFPNFYRDADEVWHRGETVRWPSAWVGVVHTVVRCR